MGSVRRHLCLSSWSGRVAPCRLFFVLILEPLFCRLRDRTANLSLHGVLFVGCARIKVADATIVFVSFQLNIKVGQKPVKRYKEVAGAKINFDKREGLRLRAWTGDIPLPGPFRWSDGSIRILGVWFRPGLQLEQNWLEVQAKVEVQVGTWLQRCVSLNGQAEVCAVYIFPLILSWLSMLPRLKVPQLALIQSLSKLLWGDQKLMVHTQVCC